jgi:hypothetical protein
MNEKLETTHLSSYKQHGGLDSSSIYNGESPMHESFENLSFNNDEEIKDEFILEDQQNLQKRRRSQ